MDTNLILTVLDAIWNFINECSKDPSKRENYISDKKFFTRNRILTFKNIVGIILNSRKSNIMTNLQNYFDWYTDLEDENKKRVTKSAFSQQRTKIKFNFFVKLLEIFRDSFYANYAPKVKKWKGWILTALDGSRISLPDSKDIRNEFGTHKHAKSENESPIAQSLYAYDVYNEIILTGHLEEKSKSEVEMALEDILSLGLGYLFLMDRGFCSFLLLFLIQAKKGKFVCRCKTRQFKQVMDFLEKGLTDDYIEMKAYQKAVKQLKALGYTVKNGQTLSVRAVKILLSSGETEVLLTNLTPEEATREELAELYNLRWGEEVAIGILKNEEQLEIFTGIRPECIKQDFFATLFMYNFEMLTEKLESEKLKKINEEHKKKGELPLAINHNQCWNTTKKIFRDWFCAKDINTSHKWILHLLPMFFDNRYEKREGRKFPRTFRVIKLLGKYITLNNYRAVG